MPISKINPDGSVKIFNNNTGEVKDVPAADLPKYNPKLVGQYQELLTKNEAVGQSAKAISSGNIGLTDLPTEERAAVANILAASGEKITSPADKKNQKAGESVTNFIESLEKSYGAGGGGTYGTGPGARIKGAIETLKGKMGLSEDAAVYNDSKAGFAATLKSLTGDTGVLTDQDFERLSKLLPGFGSTKKESVDKFNQLRDQVNAKFGVDAEQTTFQPKKENNRGAIASLLDIPFDPAVSLAEKSAQDLQTQIQTGKGKNVLDLLLPKSEKDVGLFQDVLPAAAQTATTIEGGKVLSQGAKKLLGNIFGSSAKTAAAREVAAQGVKVDTSKLIEAGDDFVKNIDPAAKKSWDILKPSIQKETDLPALLEKITNWGDKSFTKSGDKRAITEGLLKAHLYKNGRDIIKSQAPDVAELTQKLAKIKGLKETFGKFGPAMLTGAGAGIGGYLGLRAMGKKQ